LKALGSVASYLRNGKFYPINDSIPVAPFNLKLIFSRMPRWFAVRYWQRALQTSVGTLAIAPHARAARAEMGQVAREVLGLLQASPVPTPTLERLLAALTRPVLAPGNRPAGGAVQI
jgi:hypothetical protein